MKTTYWKRSQTKRAVKRARFPLPHLTTVVVISFRQGVLSPNHSFPSRFITVDFIHRLIINLIQQLINRLSIVISNQERNREGEFILSFQTVQISRFWRKKIFALMFSVDESEKNQSLILCYPVWDSGMEMPHFLTHFDTQHNDDCRNLQCDHRLRLLLLLARWEPVSWSLDSRNIVLEEQRLTLQPLISPSFSGRLKRRESASCPTQPWCTLLLMASLDSDHGHDSKYQMHAQRFPVMNTFW